MHLPTSHETWNHWAGLAITTCSLDVQMTQARRAGSSASVGGSRGSWCCRGRSKRSSTCANLRACASSCPGRCRAVAAARPRTSKAWRARREDPLCKYLWTHTAARRSPCSGLPQEAEKSDNINTAAHTLVLTTLEGKHVKGKQHACVGFTPLCLRVN